MERHWMGRDSPSQPGHRHLGSSEQALLWLVLLHFPVLSPTLPAFSTSFRQCHLPSVLATPGLSSAQADLQPWVELSPGRASSGLEPRAHHALEGQQLSSALRFLSTNCPGNILAASFLRTRKTLGTCHICSPAVHSPRRV